MQTRAATATVAAVAANNNAKWQGTLLARLIPRDRVRDGRPAETVKKSISDRESDSCSRIFTCSYDGTCGAEGSRGQSVPPLKVPWTALPFSNRIFTKIDQFEKEIDLSDHGQDLLDDELIASLDFTLDRMCSCLAENLESGSEENCSTSGEKSRIHMRMTRNPNESPSRTLRRFELSIAKRLRESLTESEKYRLAQEKKGARKTSRSTRKNSRKIRRDRSIRVMRKESSGEQLSAGEENSIVVTLDGETLDLDAIATDGDLWRLAAVRQYTDGSGSKAGKHMEIWLPELSLRVKVVAFPPTIVEVYTFESFHGDVFVGIPQFVECDLLYADNVKVTWYLDGEEKAHDVKFYVPTEEDVGRELSARVVPMRNGHNGEGFEELHTFSKKVMPVPRMPIVNPLRDEWTRRETLNRNASDCSSCASELRVVSYNLLADIYASREFDKRDQFAYCEVPFLVRTRRMPMIVAEILAYKADVICLQEVDALVYDSLLRPVFGFMGYQGFFSMKISEQKEGCAMFWSKSCFEPAKEEDMLTFGIGELFDAGESDGWDSMKAVKDLLASHEELRSVTKEKIGQVLQLVTLDVKKCGGNSQAPEKVVLANTHLFYHPLACHIRAMQAFVVCKKIDLIRRRGTNYPLPFVLVGDLNSTPQSGAAELLFKSVVPPEHDCWQHLNRYTWDMGEKDWFEEDQEAHTTHFKLEECLDAAEDRDVTIDPPCLRLPPSFPNLFYGCDNIPDFTNYVPGFVETLDYILASEPSHSNPFGFTRKRAAPTPAKEFMVPYYAMPNEFMPSDHISLVCDLKWRRYNSKHVPNCSL